MRIIDLSVALKGGIASDPPHMLPEIAYRDHKEGAKEFAAMFPGLKPEQLPDGPCTHDGRGYTGAVPHPRQRHRER